MTYLVCCGQPRWASEVYLKVRTLPGSWLIASAADSQQLTALFGDAPLPRFMFFVHWSNRVASELCAATECVNFHCTPLPYGRGAMPTANMKLRGHRDTVMTAHRMTAEIDAGPIYGTDGPISLAGSYEDVLARFVDPVVRLITMIVRDEPEPQPQVGEVVKFSRLSAEELARANAL